jgi:hypothetical protein
MDEFFGNYLKTEDIKEELTVTVKEVKAEDVGRPDDSQRKLVVYFDELDKPLVANKVNSEALADVANSREIEDWVGTRIVLYVDQNVMFAGKRVGGIRIRVPSQGVQPE